MTENSVQFGIVNANAGESRKRFLLSEVLVPNQEATDSKNSGI